MENLAQKLSIESHDEPFLDLESGKEIDLSTRLTEELIIAFCGPLGTPINLVVEETLNILKDYDYLVTIIRLSDFIKEYHPDKFKSVMTEFNRITTSIDLGNDFRKKHGKDILAKLAVHKIAIERGEEKESANADEFHTRRVCYLIDSIKNNFEFELLKRIYGDMFYMFGVYSAIEDRHRFLENKSLKSTEIPLLINRDSGEELKEGQKVDKTFPFSDYFIKTNGNNSQQIRESVSRFFKILFRKETITPTKDEYAMFAAFSAAANSSCLSRQVGAAIVDNSGSVLSVGWNDVPKFGGDLYKDSKSDDNRCFNCGGCKKDEENKKVIDSLLESITKVISAKESEKIREILESSRISDYIEHSRAIHAEMHALIIGSQKVGLQIKGSNLYCTTYPCHICARHLVCAGINTVYYVEPYRKSFAIKLHSDSIDEKESSANKMRILMYDGVAPRKFIQLFKNESLKLKDDKGNLVKSVGKNQKPRNMESLDAFPYLEKVVVTNLVSQDLIKEEIKK